jgi:hypothetical protein
MHLCFVQQGKNTSGADLIEKARAENLFWFCFNSPYQAAPLALHPQNS